MLSSLIRTEKKRRGEGYLPYRQDARAQARDGFVPCTPGLLTLFWKGPATATHQPMMHLLVPFPPLYDPPHVVSARRLQVYEYTGTRSRSPARLRRSPAR